MRSAPCFEISARGIGLDSPAATSGPAQQTDPAHQPNVSCSGDREHMGRVDRGDLHQASSRRVRDAFSARSVTITGLRRRAAAPNWRTRSPLALPAVLQAQLAERHHARSSK